MHKAIIIIRVEINR